MPNGGGASKRLAMGIAHVPIRCSHVPMLRRKAQGAIRDRKKLTIKAARESDSGLFSSQSLTRANNCGRAAHCLWMDSGCGCADSANHIT